MNVPFCTRAKWPGPISPARFASLIRHEPHESCRVALIGLPDDTGVALNAGRAGAREGPGAFRAALARYGVANPHAWEWPCVFDAGDITPAAGAGEDALLKTHARIEEATRALLRMGLFPIAVGGGHDLTLPFVRAVASHARAGGERAFGGIYFDAHLDVRETVGSGMAFRRLIEDCAVAPIVNHGCNPFVNSREHVAWFLARGGVIAADHVPGPDSMPRCPSFVSFDLDVLDAGVAPGVSAPCPDGWSLSRGAAWMELLGSCPMVRCADIMELNPSHDSDGRTARVAAHLFLSFLKGYARRGVQS